MHGILSPKPYIKNEKEKGISFLDLILEGEGRGAIAPSCPCVAPPLAASLYSFMIIETSKIFNASIKT
jgi:hypothetical protein